MNYMGGSAMTTSYPAPSTSTSPAPRRGHVADVATRFHPAPAGGLLPLVAPLLAPRQPVAWMCTAGEEVAAVGLPDGRWLDHEDDEAAHGVGASAQRVVVWPFEASARRAPTPVLPALLLHRRGVQVRVQMAGRAGRALWREVRRAREWTPERYAPTGRAALAHPADDRLAAARLARAALGAIHDGHVGKVVVAQRFGVRSASPRWALDAALHLATHRPGGTAWLAAPEGFASQSPDGLAVGCTPELLARVRGRRAETEALAGTAPGHDPDALRRSSKDAHEHAWVVDHLRRRLAALATSVQVAPAPRLHRAGPLVHLRTPVWARLRHGVTAVEVARALHPTPAVCGTPVERARAFIARTEPRPRGLYTGAAGWVEPDGAAVFHVLIRCAVATPEGPCVVAGAGIVAESDPQREADEMLAKARAVAHLLGWSGGRP